MIHDQPLLMLRCRSFSGCGRAGVSIHFDDSGGQYIENAQWHTTVNILQSTVAYLNATINVNPEMWNHRLDLTGQATPGEIRGLTGTGPGLAHKESAGWVFGRVRIRIDPFLRSKPSPLAGYLDPLLTLPPSTSLCSLNHHLQGHLPLPSSTACSQSRYTMCRWIPM